MKYSVRNIYLILFCLAISFLMAGCKINLGGGRSMGYSTTGASTGGAQTAVVVYFQNRAQQIEPSLAQKLTEALKNKILSQTNLKLVNRDGDVTFEGYVESFGTQPFSVQGGNTLTPQQNSLVVTVKMKYNNAKDPHFDFESSFSRHIEKPGTMTLDNIVNSADYNELIVNKLVDDIFTKAFVNW